MQNNQIVQKSNRGKKILWAVVAVLAAAALFFAGFFTYYLTLPAGVRSLLWVKDKVDSEYYENVGDDEFWQAAIDGATSLLDRYSAYYTAEQYDAVVDSSRGISQGTGLSFFSGTNTIANVALNSPAFYARPQGESAWGTGLETGMFVTGAGGSVDEISDTFKAVQSGDKVAYDYSALRTALSGYAAGETVYLRVSHLSGHETENCAVVPVTLSRYTESYVLYAAEGQSGSGEAYIVAYDENGTGKWTNVSGYVSVDEKVSGDTAYIRLTSFYGNAVEEFRRAAMAFQADGMGALLLDLRNDGGGRVDIMQGIAAYLLKGARSGSEPVMTAEYGSGKKEVYLADGDYYDYFFAGSEIYVAGNGNTASASEALIGAMISYDTIEAADVFVTELPNATQPARTYGKGIMQTTFSNPFTGEAIKLTTATIHWPDEASTCIHGAGISTAAGASAANGATPTQGALSYGDYGDAELAWILSQISAA